MDAVVEGSGGGLFGSEDVPMKFMNLDREYRRKLAEIIWDTRHNRVCPKDGREWNPHKLGWKCPDCGGEPRLFKILSVRKFRKGGDAR